MKLLSAMMLLSFAAQESAMAETVLPYQRSGLTTSRDSVLAGTAGVVVNGRCYGTNNRGTSNPISPSSQIYLVVDVLDASGNPTANSAIFDFPSMMTKPEGITTGDHCGITSLPSGQINLGGSSVSINDAIANAGGDQSVFLQAFNVDTLKNNNSRQTVSCSIFPMSMPRPSNIDLDAKLRIRPVQGFTYATISREFYGYNGLMDRGTKVDIKQNSQKGGYGSNTKFLQITAAFPGQDGFCGGYHSPLMFFFSDKLPKFEGKSVLLKGNKNPTSWVEKNHEGYFLVRLGKAADKIKPEALFGNDETHRDGFLKLQTLDSNGDKVLDKNDAAFGELYLWKDANANSKNDKGEIKKLSDFKVESINLNYNDTYKLERNKSILKGRSTFSYLDSEGRAKEGEIFDVFFEDMK